MSETDFSRILINERALYKRFRTFESAFDLIRTASIDRHINIADFVGRSALAVAAHDLDLPWRHVTRTEHAIDDRRTSNPVHRHGHDFGPWQIERMS